MRLTPEARALDILCWKHDHELCGFVPVGFIDFGGHLEPFCQIHMDRHLADVENHIERCADDSDTSIRVRRWKVVPLEKGRPLYIVQEVLRT